MIFFHIIAVITMLVGGTWIGLLVGPAIGEGLFRLPFNQMVPLLTGLLMPGLGFFVAGGILFCLATIGMRVGRPIRIVSRKEYDD